MRTVSPSDLEWATCLLRRHRFVRNRPPEHELCLAGQCADVSAGFGSKEGLVSRCARGGGHLLQGDLTNAIFTEADLRRADFSGAEADALFFRADLAGANLTATRPWRARIMEGLPSEPLVSLTTRDVKGVGEMTAICQTLRLAHDHYSADV